MKGVDWVETSSSDLNLNRSRESESRIQKKVKRLFFILLFVLSLFFWLPTPGSWILTFADAQTTETAAQPIATIEVEGLSSIPEWELLYLLDLSRGRPLDRKALQEGIERAFLKGLFDDIVVESLDQEHTRIRVTVKEKKIIGAIKVQGNAHFSKRFIKKQTALSKGERLSWLKVRRGISNLKEEMAKRGFANADIAAAVVPRKGNTVEVAITVQEGTPARIRDITIAGPDEVVRSYLKLSPGDIFDAKQLESLEEKVIRNYRKKGYVGAALSSTFSNGILSIVLDPGKKLTVGFKGNAGISSKTLMKEIPFYEIDEISEDLIEETASRIVSLYHSHGYPFVQVAPVQSVPERNHIHLDFYIFEGERYRVRSIAFEGVTIPAKRLKDIIAHKTGAYYNPELLETDVENLTEFYHALGYLYLEVQEPEVSLTNGNAAIVFDLREGPQVVLKELSLKNNSVFSDKELLDAIPLRLGQPYNEVDVSDARRKILELYNRKGFLDAKVATEREIVDTSASVTFTVHEGGITYFGRNVIIGNEQTRPRVIQRELSVKEDTPFDYSILLKERQKLYRLGLFTDIEITPAEKRDATRDIVYRVKEARPGAVEFGVGYGEYEEFRAFFDVSYRNLWGMNRQLSFRTELSTLEQRYILSYFEPWFLNEDLTFRALLLHEERKERNIEKDEIRYRLKRDTITAGIEKRLTETLKAELNYDFSVVKTFDVKPDVILSREDVGTLIISGIRPGLIYDTRDNPFEPRKGLLAGLSFKFASPLLLSETHFAKLSLYVNKYTGLGRRNVLAVSLRGGIAKGFGDTRELPIVERFFLGGRTTVRGYAQDALGPKGADDNPTGGNAFAMGNFEVRTDIGRGFGLVTFVDAGNVWQRVEDTDISSLKYTTGLGLRYNTPVGPFRIDYGYKLNPEKGESRGEIHFSLGHAF